MMTNKMKKSSACSACASLFEICVLGDREHFFVDEDEEVLL